MGLDFLPTYKTFLPVTSSIAAATGTTPSVEAEHVLYTATAITDLVVLGSTLQTF